MERGLELLKKVIQVANSSIGFEDRLQGILDLLVRKEGMERAILLSVTPGYEAFELKKISPREVSWDGQSFNLARTPIGEHPSKSNTPFHSPFESERAQGPDQEPSV